MPNRPKEPDKGKDPDKLKSGKWQIRVKRFGGSNPRPTTIKFVALQRLRGFSTSLPPLHSPSGTPALVGVHHALQQHATRDGQVLWTL